MKIRRALGLFTVGAAILLSLKPGAATFGQESPAPPPLIMTVSATAPKLVDCSADGRFFVFATRDGRIKYSRTEDGANLRTFYMCQPQGIVLSPDGRWLAACGNFNGCFARIKVWNVKDGPLLCTLETEVESQSLFAFSPDGKFLATTSGSRIDLWHLREERVIWFETFPKNIAHFALNSQDGGTLVVVCEDGTARRFSLP